MKPDENINTHMDANKLPRALPHPGALIFLWVCILVAIQSLATNALLAAVVLMLSVAYVMCAARLRTLLRRTRWIMLTLLLIYAYATPGAAVWTMLGQFSPTREGVADGLLQLCRLLGALAALAILLQMLPRQKLIGGLYALAYPLKIVGWSRERVAARLALTLHYAEDAMHQARGSWRDSMSDMLAAIPSTHEDKHEHIEIHVTPFTLRDGVLTVTGCALLLWVLL